MLYGRTAARPSRCAAAASARCPRWRKCSGNFPPDRRFVFNFKSKDPRDADALLAAFSRAGVKPDDKYSYYGHPRVTDRLKQLVPGAWTFFKQEIRACMTDYVEIGWTGYVPENCRNTTVVIPLNYQWAIWGWPTDSLTGWRRTTPR
jgi:hypothetical protein